MVSRSRNVSNNRASVSAAAALVTLNVVESACRAGSAGLGVDGVARERVVVGVGRTVRPPIATLA